MLRGIEEIDNKSALELDKLVQEVNFLQNEKKELNKAIETKDKNLEGNKIPLSSKVNDVA